MHCVHVRECVADRIDDGGHHRIGEFAEAIVDPQSLSSRVHQSGSSQIRQMPRRFRLRNLEALVDVADADLACQQKTQDAEARGVGERLEEGFHFVQLLSHIYLP